MNIFFHLSASKSKNEEVRAYDIKLSAGAKEIVDGDLAPVSVTFQAGSVTVNCDKGHTEVIDPAVAATCTEAGKTEGKHCSVCGTVLVAQEEIPATGHTWTAASCTSPRTCAVCGAEDGEALGHDWSAWTQVTAATCTEAGKESRSCQREGCTAAEEREIPATGHTEVIDPAVAATCTEAGKTEGKHCSVCGAVLVAQEEIPATGHTERRFRRMLFPLPMSARAAMKKRSIAPSAVRSSAGGQE